MRTRSALALALSASALASVTLSAPAQATVLGSLCEITGNVNFADKPKAAPGPISYTLTGEVVGCLQSPNNGALDEAQSGTFQIGGTVTVDDVEHALQPGSGTASCAGGTTKGEGAIVWADGTISLISFDTVNAARVVAVRGQIVDTIGQLKTTNTKYAVGDAFDGPLVLDKVDTARCVDTGVPSATFTSQAVIGSYK